MSSAAGRSARTPEPADRGEMVRAVQRYQSARMRRTHEGLLRTPAYSRFCEFVLTDLYGSPVLGAHRSSALSRLVDLVEPALPSAIHGGARSLVELYALSEELDDRLARWLLRGGATPAFSTEEFEAAYYRCDDYDDRIRQIDLFEASTSFGHALRIESSGGPLLAAASAAARLPQLGPLMALLERGYHVVDRTIAIGPFLEAVRSGEAAYVDGVYARQRRLATLGEGHSAVCEITTLRSQRPAAANSEGD